MNNYGKELIASAVREADKKYIDNRFGINKGLEEALRKKYIKVEKNEEKYIEILRFNIIFYKSIIKKLELIVEMWIQKGVISGTKSVEVSIENITKSSRSYVNKAMKEGIEYLNEKDKKILFSYDNCEGYERLEKVENDYKILNLYKDILGMVITVISSEVRKYNKILDMGVEETKIAMMNEIFELINEILFSEDPATANFEDEALIEGEKEADGSIEENEQKAISFKKYVSMISMPEILVKTNNIFELAKTTEGLEDEDVYGFTDDMRAFVSCVVLLMDYLAEKEQTIIENIFRMFIVGQINCVQFKKMIDRFIIEYSFLDRKTWIECQRKVKTDFNMENNSFFGIKTLREDEEDFSVTQKMEFAEKLSEYENVRKALNALKEEEEKGEKLTERLKKGFQSFSDKVKIAPEEIEEQFSEEFYDDDYEDEEFDEDDIEEEKVGRFGSRLKSFFKKNEEDFEEENEEEEEEEFEPEIDESKFRGDKTIQDENAVAILKMREKEKMREEEHLKKEMEQLKSERQLVEELNKKGSLSLAEAKDIVLDESDYAYKKDGSENTRGQSSQERKDLLENTVDGQITALDIQRELDKKKEEKKLKKTAKATKAELEGFDKEEDNMFKPILGETQRINLDDIEKTRKLKVEEVKKEVPPKKEEEFEGQVISELEAMKANKCDGIEVTPVAPKDDVKVDLSSLGKKKKVETPKEEEETVGFKEKFKNLSNKMSSNKDDEEEGIFSKKKMVRDGLIALAIIVLIGSTYAYFIKNYKSPIAGKPSTEVATDKDGKKVVIKTEKDKLNNKTTEITQKTEAEKEKDETEKKASALDREAEKYKGEKGKYYTVFIGATKSKDGAESVAYNFANRGIKSEVVRNGGYYMLRVGEYFNYNEAAAESRRISAKGVQNYIASQNKYYDLKTEAFKVRIPDLTADQLTTDYNDLKNQISSTGKNTNYVINLDEIYTEALKQKQ